MNKHQVRNTDPATPPALVREGNAGIHVAEYLTVLPPKDVLKQKLHLAIERSRSTLDKRLDDVSAETSALRST